MSGSLEIKRRSARIVTVIRMMVSRTTTVKMCLMVTIFVVCVTSVRAAKSDNFFDGKSTTPITPKSKVESEEFLSNATFRNEHNILSVGNELWDNIIHDCYKKPSFSCFQKNIFWYLDRTLQLKDFNVTSRLSFYKNNINFTQYAPPSNEHDQDDLSNEISDESRSESAIEEVTDALYDKSVKFMITHDMELKMPEILFDGAIFRVSPRSIEGNGAIVKLELVPKMEIETRESGRIFKKKIQKFFKNKLLLSFLALILIVKLIKIKLFWLLPIIVGVGTAKKLLLKFLLFLFPALSHLFKLCSYYQENYHQTKYHHHHHSINHHHTVVPVWYNEHDHHSSSAVIPNGPELIFTNPPKGNPADYIHGSPHGALHGSPHGSPHGPTHGSHHGPPHHAHYPTGWESSGPGLGSEYIGDINRNAQVESNGSFKPKLDDANELSSWGLGTTYAPTASHSYNINPLMEDQPSLVNQKLKTLGPVYVQKKPSLAAAQIAAQYDSAINQQMTKEVHRTQAQVKEALRIEAEQRLIAQQQKFLENQPFVANPEPLKPVGYDQFYSPILEKIDKILLQLGFTDDFCKERLVCSMYKNPSRFTPHSNFISAELSRDTSELQRPSATNQAVLKFYRFVQAARDGQDQRDCMRLYPQCKISTE